MPSAMLKVRSSRRAAGLKPADYDHEISLVDHDGTRGLSARNAGEGDMERVSTESRLLPAVAEQDGLSPQQSPRTDYSAEEGRLQERPAEELRHEQELPHPALRPSIEIQGTFLLLGPSRSCSLN